MRTAVVVSFSLIWLASAALAQSGPASPQPKAPAASTQPPADASKKKVGGADTVKKQPQAPDGKSGVTEALTTCLEIWDPATHMTRQQWARACRRVADRLKNTAVK